MRRILLHPLVWNDKQRKDINSLQDMMEEQERQLQETAESLKNLREAIGDDLDWIFKTLNEITGGERPEKNAAMEELAERLDDLEARVADLESK